MRCSDQWISTLGTKAESSDPLRGTTDTLYRPANGLDNPPCGSYDCCMRVMYINMQ